MKTNDTQNNAQHLERAPGSAAPRHQHPAHPCVCWWRGGAVSPQSANSERGGLEGSGTEGDPYRIATADDLLEFADKVNNQNRTSAWAILTANIDLSSVCGENIDGDPVSWTPIGSDSSRYKGTFDGNNYTISGLYIDSSSANDQGLFGFVGIQGTVQNLSVSGSVSGSGNSVGGVVGLNSGSVEDCDFTGSVSGSGNSVGGVVGYNSDISTVENCYNTGAVSGGECVGGVVGLNSGNVKNCYNTGTVTGTDDYVGGVVGQSFSASVTNSYNTGKVSGNSYVGGVVGWNDSGSSTVTDCYFLQDTAGSGIGSGKPSEENVKSLTAEEFADQRKFSSWDFESTWKIESIFGRPTLQANAEIGGTANNPYKIFTATQLAAFRDLVNDENDQTADPDAHAKLMNNINLNPDMKISEDGTVTGAHDQWIPIGSISNEYTGTFNGNGKTISGLYINTTSYEDQGLFGYLSGTVQNLSVSGSVSGDWHVGGVVGYNNGGTVTGCIFSGSGSVSGSYHVGGIVGQNRGSVENCYNTGAVSGPDSGYSNVVGGVVGYNDSGANVENCYNTGTVSGPDSGSGNFVGGVVGYNYHGTSVENCYNTGSVKGPDSGSGDWYVGGVVGQNFGGTVENCYNTGSVTVTGSDGRVGGVVGYNSGPVKNCYNTGTVSDGTTSGGIVGQNSGSGSVTNCYFLKTADVNKNLSGIGFGGEGQEAIQKTADAFQSGEVAYLLQSKQITPVWGQNIGEDKSPVLTSDQEKTVYRVPVDLNYTGAQADQVIYTNSTLNAKEPTREGYTFDGWYDSNGNPVTAITATTAKLYAQWTPVEEPDPEPEEPPYTGKYSYEVSTSVGDHGSLTVDRYATEGEKVTITVTPDDAYLLDDISVTAGGKEVALTAGGDGTYTFTMPSADVKITATFAEDPDWTPDEPEEPATDVSDIFLDVAPNAWYKDAVQYAYDNGLMTGVSATEFAPEATTTRAMIVSILARLENVTTAEAAGFADVDDNDWYATAVNWAANVGVVNGYEDNTFQPNTAITREQLAAILMNYAAYKGEDVSNRADLTSYTDQPSTWAEEAMSWAVAEGLISGVTADTLQPQGAATRAQVAAILQRFLSE